MLCILTEPSCLQLFCPKTKANLECKKRSRLNYWVVVWLPAQYIKLESNHWSRNISFDALKSFSISFQKTIELKNVLVLSIQNKCPINGKKVEERIYKINGLCKMTIRIPIEKKTHTGERFNFLSKNLIRIKIWNLCAKIQICHF